MSGLKINSKFIAFVPFLLLAGCASSPKPLAKDKLGSFTSAKNLVDELKLNYFEVSYDGLLGGYEKLKEPRLYLSQFCELNQKSKFTQLVDFGFLSSANNSVKKSVKGSFGKFSCLSNGESLWEVEIHGKHWKSKNPFLVGGLRTSRVAVTIKDKYELEAIAAQKQNAEELREKQRLAKLVEQERMEHNRKENQKLTSIQYNNATLQSKSIGDKVCTSDNLFGYVEATSNERIKVSVVGKVVNVNSSQYLWLSDYFFFNPQMSDKNFTHEPVNVKTIWATFSDWGTCSFSVNV